MSSVKSIIKRVEKAKKEGQQYVTVRVDVVKRVILSGEYEKVACEYSYTDDYAYDAANNYGKGVLDHEAAVKMAEMWLKPGTRCYVSKFDPIIINIVPYSGLCYALYLKPDAPKVKRIKKANIEIKNPDEPATKKQLWALHCITKLDTRGLKVTRKQASEWIEMASSGIDITLLVKNALKQEKVM